jgi:hypothetical protein
MKKSYSAFLLIALGGLLAFALFILMDGVGELASYFANTSNNPETLADLGFVNLFSGIGLSLFAVFLLAFPEGKRFRNLLLLYFFFFTLRSVAVGAIIWSSSANGSDYALAGEVYCLMSAVAFVDVIVLLFVSPKRGKPLAINMTVLVSYLYIVEAVLSSLEMVYYETLKVSPNGQYYASQVALLDSTLMIQLCLMVFFGVFLLIGLFRDHPELAIMVSPEKNSSSSALPLDRSNEAKEEESAKAIEHLNALKKLHDEGVLTDDEYEAKRQETVRRI